MKTNQNRSKGGKLSSSLGRVAWASAALALIAASTSATLEADAAEVSPRVVVTYTVRDYADETQSLYLARVRAPKEVELAFELSGRVDAIAETTGVSFKAGEMLGRLDSTRYELAYKEAQQRLAYAEKELKRKKSLFKGGSSTEAELDRAENEAVLAEIAWKRAQEDLQDCSLLAPFDGKLATKRVEVGSYVAPGQSVLVFQESGNTEVELYRTERQLLKLLSDLREDRVEVHIADGALKGSELLLKDYATSPDPLSGAYRVSFSLYGDGDDVLLPGAPVRLAVVEKVASQAARAVKIPADALVTLPDGSFQVWALVEGEKSPEARKVEVGEVRKGAVVVTLGLSIGDRVVTYGASLLRSDSVVTESSEV